MIWCMKGYKPSPESVITKILFYWDTKVIQAEPDAIQPYHHRRWWRMSTCNSGSLHNASAMIWQVSAWTFWSLESLIKIWMSDFQANYTPQLVVSALQLNFFHIGHKWSLAWEGVSPVMTYELDLYLSSHSAITFNKTTKIWHIL